jgi:hypothetical protein
MRKELLEAKQKLKEMEHVVRKSERSLDVSRLDHNQLSASLAGNVGKLDRLLIHARSMRQDSADQRVDMIAGRRRHQHRVKVSPLLDALTVFLYLIPTFLFRTESLQDEAQRCNKEKQESNRKKRLAQQKSHRLQIRLDALLEPGHVDDQEKEDDDDDVMAKWDIRYNRRNKGMKPDFEQHVRCVLATGATARQAQDMLLLDASYMLPTEDAATLASSLPQIRWFQDQREALGIESTSYLYVFMRIAAASRVVQVKCKP